MSGAPTWRATGGRRRRGEDFDPADAETVATIKELIETRVRPAVADDGGDIVFHGFREGTVYPAHARRLLGVPVVDGDAARRHRAPAATLLSGGRRGARRLISSHAESKVDRPAPSGRGLFTWQKLEPRSHRRAAMANRLGARRPEPAPSSTRARTTRGSQEGRTGRHPARDRRHYENGTDQRQLPARPHHLRQIRRGQAAAWRHFFRQRTGPKPCRLRSAPSSATTPASTSTCPASFPTTRGPHLVRGQDAVVTDDGDAQRHIAGRLPHDRRARARSRLSAPCPASTTPASTRSSFPTAASSRTSCATSATAIQPASSTGRPLRLRRDRENPLTAHGPPMTEVSG